MLNNIFKKACAITAVAAGNMAAVSMITDKTTVDQYVFAALSSLFAGGVTLLDQFVN